jgi:hypothetical protein
MQEAEIRRIAVQSQPRQIVHEPPISKKTHHKKGLVEWLKGKALSSNLSTAKKKKKKLQCLDLQGNICRKRNPFLIKSYSSITMRKQLSWLALDTEERYYFTKNLLCS